MKRRAKGKKKIAFSKIIFAGVSIRRLDLEPKNLIFNSKQLL